MIVVGLVAAACVANGSDGPAANNADTTTTVDPPATSTTSTAATGDLGIIADSLEGLWLVQVEAEKGRGMWVDPAAGRITLAAWFEEWSGTLTVRPSTANLYGYLARRYLLPTFGSTELSKVTTTDVRRWLASLQNRDLSQNTVAKAYRLLSRVMRAAVNDGLIGRTPCTVQGAGTERSPEMRFVTVEEVHEIAAAVPEHYRAMVLLAAFGGLRWGELTGLRRSRVDLLHRSITVAEQLTEVNGRLEFGPPKTDSGRRTVAIPAFVCEELEAHLNAFAEPGKNGLVFPAPEGGPMRRSNFRRRIWLPALASAGIEGARFHDLRHTAGTMAAIAGATTRELMSRLGHASPRAAIIYQHATEERDAEIAAKLDALAASPRPTGHQDADGDLVELHENTA